VEPTGYDAASVDAVTAMTSSAQSGTAVVEGLAEPDGEVDGLADVALEDGLVVVDGVVDPLEVGDADGDPAASDEPPEPNAFWATQRTPRSSATTTSSASSRRTQ
jgi:hypothetical protein